MESSVLFGLTSATGLTCVASTIPLRTPPFDGFAICKVGSELRVHDFGGQESRNLSTLRLLIAAVERFRVADFPWILINTGDRDHPASCEGYRVFSYSTTSGDYAHACPDFIFDHWKETQLDDYESACGELSALGASPPATDLLGWRGAGTHPARAVLVTHDDKQQFDVELIQWDRSRPERLNCRNFVSLPDQVRRWRYLIDVEGFGYSARLKLLFFSRRVVFLQQRPYQEWYFPQLQPWVHYVPVNRDLSDLVQNLDRLRADPLLEANISAQALQFAMAKLTRTAALQRWAELLATCRGFSAALPAP